MTQPQRSPNLESGPPLPAPIRRDVSTESADRARAEDIALVDCMAAGDREALAHLYDRYSSSLLGLAIQILRDREEAEEILQEVLMQAWQQAERYDSRRASVRTWLALMTRSRAIDRRRVNSTRARTVVNVKRSGTLRTEVEAEGGKNIWLGQLRDRLREELAKIPDAQRQIIEMLYFGGLTQLQVSQQIDVPLGTVKTRTLLGMQKLRRALGKELSFGWAGAPPGEVLRSRS